MTAHHSTHMVLFKMLIHAPPLQQWKERDQVFMNGQRMYGKAATAADPFIMLQ